MKIKRGSKLLGIINSKPVIGAFIFIMLSLVMVFAGDVIVKDGNLNINNSLTIDAQAADISMNSNKITNVTDPTDDQDVATKKYVDDNSGSLSSYETGWISRSDWTHVHLGSNTTKNTDSNVTHNLDAPLSDLVVKLLISTDGTDATSFEVVDGSTGTTQWGYTLHYVDDNSTLVHTFNSGILYMTADASTRAVDAEDWYYKIKVWKLG